MVKSYKSMFRRIQDSRSKNSLFRIFPYTTGMLRFFRISAIFVVFLGFLHPVLAKAPPAPPYGNVGKQLMQIYQIDHRLQFGDISASMRENLKGLREKTTRIVGESSILLENAWKKPPTFDATRKYVSYIQKYHLSCEIAAVKMVLESMGKRISEDAIYAGIPRYSEALSGSLWGHPDVEFVGYITGSQALRTGYGIHEKPLERYLEREGYSADSTNSYAYSGSMNPDSHLSGLLSTVEDGHHVILW